MFLAWPNRTGILRWILFLSLFLPACAGALDEALQKTQAESLKPGYGICLFDARGELWSKYEGLANETTGVPFSRNTILRVGGVSELFTVVLALQQVDAGRMDPETPVAAYLPDMFSGAPQGSPSEKIGRLKLRLLMSHLSGTGANFFLGYRDYDPFLNLREYLQDVNLKYPPDIKFLHSSAMIDLLGLAVEKVSGKGFEELAQTTLFGPLGMETSSFRYGASPLLANLRYKSGAPDSYATRIPGFREAVVPSGSMQASIKDLITFYSTLLREGAETSPRLLSRCSLSAMFSSQSADVEQRQGLRIGYTWKLSLPELAYLGKVAWYTGKHLSHRNVVILLPDLGLGVVCATNAWSIFDRETILPMAVTVLKTYARESLKLPEPPPLIPVRVPMPQQLKSQASGLYASLYGVYRVQPKGDALLVSSNTLDASLEHIGQSTFRSDSDGPLDQMTFTPPDALRLSMHNGMVIEAQKVSTSPVHRAWLTLRGTYRLAQVQAGALYAFTLGSFEGLPVISGDDGVELLIEPISDGVATIHCDESSRFFGKGIKVWGDQGLLLDGVAYRRVP